MAVIPDPVWKELEGHPLLKGLRVTDAGFFPKASGHFVRRSSAIPCEVLIACIEGSGVVTTPGGEAILSPGDLVWLPSGKPHAYRASAERPWSILWVHFAGSECDGWRDLLFGNDPRLLCRVPPERMGELSLDRIHAILEKGHSLVDLAEAAGAFRQSLSALARLRSWPGATPSARARVAACVEKLRTGWNHVHRLEELAIQAGVSVSHFSTLFRMETGCSPIDFLIRQRIAHAARLLATTEGSVSSVAATIGCEDPYYFSRQFRRVMGVSPRAYRKKHLPGSG
jgi:AraC-like DNA-binding protein